MWQLGKQFTLFFGVCPLDCGSDIGNECRCSHCEYCIGRFIVLSMREVRRYRNVSSILASRQDEKKFLRLSRSQDRKFFATAYVLNRATIHFSEALRVSTSLVPC